MSAKKKEKKADIASGANSVKNSQSAESDTDSRVLRMTDEIRELKARCDSLEAENRKLKHRDTDTGGTENYKHYHTLFSEIGYGFAIHRMLYDDSGIPSDYETLEVNRAYEQILSIKQEDIVSRKASEILPADELVKWVSVFGKVVLTGVAEHYEIFSPFTEKYFHGYAFSPEKDRFVVLFEDITDRKLAAIALERSEYVLKKAQMIGHLGTWIWHVNSNTVEWSEEMYRIFGIENNGEHLILPEVIGKAVHPEDRTKVEESNRSVAENKAPIPLEYRVVHPDGSIRWVWAEAGELFLDADGNPERLTGIILDITERKAVEEMLQESEHRLLDTLEFNKNILYTSSIGILTYDEHGECTFANEAAAAIVGTTIEVLLAQNFTKLDSWKESVMYENAKETFVSGKSRKLEVHLKTTFGKEVWLDISFSRFSFGGKQHLLVFLYEISERMKAEASLRESEERYKALFEAVPEPIFLTDTESGFLIESNPAASEKYGYSSDEFCLIRITELSAEPEKTEAAIRIPGKHFIPYRLHRKKNGELFPVDISFDSLEIGGRRINVSVVRDITARNAAEDALRKSEARFRALIEHGHDAIALLAEDGTVIYDSPSVARVLGYSHGERIGRNVSEFVHPDDKEKMEKGFAGFARTTGDVAPSFQRFLHKNGTVRYIEGVRTNLLDDPAVHAIVVNYRDITERKISDDALRESEERHRRLFENAAIAIFRTHADGRILDVNSTFARLFGYDSSEHLVQSLIHADEVFADPSDRSLLLERIRNESRLVRVEVLYRRRDGSTFTGELTVSGVLDSERKLKYVEGFIQDISERKKAETALRESEERFRCFVEQAGDGFELVAADGTFLDVNTEECRMLGYQRSELLGLSVPDIDPNLTVTQYKSDFNNLIGKPPATFETFHTRKDGTVFPVEVSVSIISIGGRNAAITIVRDITKRKEVEDAIRESEEKYRNLSENINIGIFQSTLDGHPIYANSTIAQIAGYSDPDDFMSVPTQRFYSSEDKMEALLGELGEKGSIRNREVLAVRKDGTRLWVSMNAVILKSGTSLPPSLLGSVIDISDRKRAEERAESERKRAEHLSTFPELDPNPIIEVSPGGDISYANNAARTALAEAGHSDLMFFFGDKREELLATVTQHKESLVKREAEIGARVFAESIEYIESLDRVRLYATDITKRRQVEDSLRMSEIRYRELFNNISSGVAIYEARENGEDFVFRDFNKAGETMDNEKKEDVIGRSVWEKRPGIKEFGLLEVFKRVWRTGSSEFFPVNFYKDHRLVGWYENFVYRLPTGEIVAVFDNVTEKKKAEEELRMSEEKYRTLFSNMQEGFAHCKMIFDRGEPADFVYLDVNDKFETLTGLRDVVGKRMTELVPGITERDYELFIRYGRVVRSGVPEKFEYYLNTLSIWLSTSVYTPMPDHFVAVFEVITERKRIESALVRREQELSNLSARLMQVREEERVKIARNVHDDIGHAVMIVKMDLFLLEKSIKSGTEVGSAIESIKAHLDGVVDAIQRISLEIRPPMLYDLGIAEALGFFVKRFTEQTGIECESEIGDDIPGMQGERAIAVYRIIQEAFTNVYRHAGAGLIRFSMRLEKKELVVKITDNGKGIEEHLLENVHSLGLLGMKERTHILGGKLDIRTLGEGGTEVLLRVPMEERKDQE